MEHIFGSLVWIVFWVLIFGQGTIKMWIRHRERELELRALGRLPAADPLAGSQEIKSLRDEIASLRDTTTQYDLTVDRTLRELNQRISSLEAKMAALPQADNAPLTPSAPPSPTASIAPTSIFVYTAGAEHAQQSVASHA